MLPSQLYCVPTRSDAVMRFGRSLNQHVDVRVSSTIPKTEVYDKDDLQCAHKLELTNTKRCGLVLVKLLQEVHHYDDWHKPPVDLVQHRSVLLRSDVEGYRCVAQDLERGILILARARQGAWRLVQRRRNLFMVDVDFLDIVERRRSRGADGHVEAWRAGRLEDQQTR